MNQASQPHFQQLCVLIPAYQPSDNLVAMVAELLTYYYQRIVVVDDGSAPSQLTVFEKIQSLGHVTVLHHSENTGKGSAIKTGLRWILKNYPQILGVVTMDADGQHLVKDVVAVSSSFLQQPEQLVLGVRKFSPGVPWRSRIGNILTRVLFRYRYHVALQDTQTGLRVMPQALLRKFSHLPQQRYEYDMACLIAAIRSGCIIHQIPITTIYIKNDISSHFQPVLDSMRIYYVFMRFALISLVSYSIELLLFITLHYFTHIIFVSLLIARLVSASFNFYQNKFTVYQSADLALLKQQLFGYIALGSILFLLSYLLINGCVHLGMGVVKAKITVDLLLFLFNFTMQRLIVFRRIK